MALKDADARCVGNHFVPAPPSLLPLGLARNLLRTLPRVTDRAARTDNCRGSSLPCEFGPSRDADRPSSMQGQDVALLLKLAIQNAPQVPSKDLAESLFHLSVRGVEVSEA